MFIIFLAFRINRRIFYKKNNFNITHCTFKKSPDSSPAMFYKQHFSPALIGSSEEHSILAVGEAGVELLTFLQQRFLLRLVEAVDLQVAVSVEGLPLHRLLGVFLGFPLHLLGVHAYERLASLGLLMRRSGGAK